MKYCELFLEIICPQMSGAQAPVSKRVCVIFPLFENIFINKLVENGVINKLGWERVPCSFPLQNIHTNLSGNP